MPSAMDRDPLRFGSIAGPITADVESAGEGVVAFPGMRRVPDAVAQRTLASFDYGMLSRDLAATAQAAAARIKQRTSAAILDTGRDPTAIKVLLNHGQFGGWLRAEFGMSIRSAQDFMRAAALADEKCVIVAYLPASVVLQIARSSAAVQDIVSTRLASDQVSADQVRPALRAAARELRQGGTAGPSDVESTAPQAAGSTDPEPKREADRAALLAPIVRATVNRVGDLAATILEATRSGPDTDNRWDAFSRALRVGLQQAVMPPAPATPVRAWQDLRDTAMRSPAITRAQQTLLATLGTRGPPTEEQLAKLDHITGKRI